MTSLLELKEKIKYIYSRYETFIVPVAKFLLTLIVLNTLNGKMGYMTQLNNIAVVLIVSLMCSFLPTGCIVLFGALFSLMHMYALSLEVLLVGFCLYLVMFLPFFRFGPKDSLIVVLTPLLFAMKIPYVIPIAAGLLCGPASVVSVGCGIAVFYLLQTVVTNAQAINTLGDSENTAKVRLIIDGLIGNKSMIVMIAAFAVTVLVVYLIRRMSIDYSWTIAMVAGVMVDIVVLLIGDLIYDINISVVGALLGSLLALVVGKVIEFFRFCVDYSRTEKVQFEDDEYYYYVKAVPKMTIAVSSRTVKRINAQYSRQDSAPSRSRTQPGRPGAGAQSRPAPNRGTGRSVITERTAHDSRSTHSTASRPPGRRNSRSVTISAADEDFLAESQDDYEDLF